MPIDRTKAGRLRAVLAAVLLATCARTAAQSQPLEPPSLRLAIAGPARTLFSPMQACDGNDVPDVNARAFRDAQGQTVVFALHDLNRALRGPDLRHLKIDCSIPFRGHHDPDPAAYDDNAWIASIWTADGRRVSALAHHEYHASEHPGRCQSRDFMACWYNTILELRSSDGGRSFSKPKHAVVAAAPFRQDVDQTRHRGFFNPSNIVSYRGAWYFFASTTGWPGQHYGACLFRSRTPDEPGSWRAYDGQTFSIRYRDPYEGSRSPPRPCDVIEPFFVPVGAVVKDRRSGTFIAVWQAKADTGPFPVSGFYYATSADLLRWSAPRLLLAGGTLYDDPCGSGGRLINYPSLLDPAAATRDYEDVGPQPWLVYARLRVEGCEVTSDRILLRAPIAISPAGASPAGHAR